MSAVISVVVPVYNAEPYLRQCVDSILGQSFADLELVLVDDGSPDGCGAICDEYAAADRRVRVLHKENGGPASAVMAGVQAASGEYLGFVDSDDWIDPDYYADLLQGITASGADAVEGERIEEIDPPMLRVRPQPVTYAGRSQIRALMREYFLATLTPSTGLRLVSYSRCDKLYRRERWTENLSLMDSGLTLDDDRVENAAVLASCEKFVLLSGTARYHYRQNFRSVSHTYSADHFNAIGRLYDDLIRIADAYDLEKEPIAVYVGGCAYRWTYVTVAQPIPFREKRDRVRQLLRLTPPGVMAKYARARGSLIIRLLCAMLQAGLVTPCVCAIRLHAALTGGEK